MNEITDQKDVNDGLTMSDIVANQLGSKVNEKAKEKAKLRKKAIRKQDRRKLMDDARYIYKYIHLEEHLTNKGSRIGILLGSLLPNGKILITTSRTNLEMGDIFDPERSFEIALGRYCTYVEGRGFEGSKKIDSDFGPYMSRFIDRICRYFHVEESDIIIPQIHVPTTEQALYRAELKRSYAMNYPTWF